MIYNIGFRLEYTWDGDADIQCPNPKCEQKYDVKWQTEYGDANIGEHDAHCDKCGNDFHFSVHNQFNSWQ